MEKTYLDIFENIVKEQIERAERLKKSEDQISFKDLNSIVIGMVSGDGIGPIIMAEAEKVLNKLLSEELESGKVELRKIEGLTLENRIKELSAVPEDVLEKIKNCHVILKGPTTTPSKSDNLPNLESANVRLRKELDLFANVRPVVIPHLAIDWTFFRENTEGEYTLGSKGIDVRDDLSIDFKVTTDAGTRRIARAAFEYAKSRGNQKVSIVTKANIMKKTDGKFLSICEEIAKDYPEIAVDSWYVDIMAANLINPDLQNSFNVFILPNLYGDIITDEAAQLQGGVGTAGSANIGSRYAMFEAIHGSAPRMLKDGTAIYANPASILKAAAMLLNHIGFEEKSLALTSAIEMTEANLNMCGSSEGNTAVDFGNAVQEAI